MTKLRNISLATRFYVNYDWNILSACYEMFRMWRRKRVWMGRARMDNSKNKKGVKKELRQVKNLLPPLTSNLIKIFIDNAFFFG
jgi:hypothetical protein